MTSQKILARDGLRGDMRDTGGTLVLQHGLNTAVADLLPCRKLRANKGVFFVVCGIGFGYKIRLIRIVEKILSRNILANGGDI